MGSSAQARPDAGADDARGGNLRSPAFISARAHARRLAIGAMALAACVILLLAGAGITALLAPASVWPTLLCNNAASLLLLAAALQAARWPARWRARRLAPELVPGPMEAAEALGWYDRLMNTVEARILAGLHQLGLAPLCLLAWSLLALALARASWNLTLAAGNPSTSSKVCAVVALLLAFSLLVSERHLASETPERWPEAASLVPFLRLAIFGLALSALCLLFLAPDAVWPARVAALWGLLPALVAVELAGRATLAFFAPRHGEQPPKMLADSFVCGLLQWPPAPLQALQAELHSRLGIDLRQVWAFNYMRRASLPVLGVVLGLGWALTGVKEIPLAGRGIYERFGSPLSVLGPGLHLGLPWPLGRVVAVENGVVHELATGQTGPAAAEATVDGPAPESANRLWDATHARDNTQVIASGEGTRQNFQVVNMDVRFIYRLGLTDADALAATYHSADLPGLIRSSASRVLLHTLASRTLDGLLSDDRRGLAQSIGSAVQADLHRMNSGVEILATVIEAIHPPAGAANAYHGVQAAQIAAQALVARERGAAAAATSTAHLNAFDIQAQAQASARESQASAQVEQRLFQAERVSYAQAGQAFVFERYLAQLRQGLGQAQLLVLDHRLGGRDTDGAPTLDLRTFLAPVDAAPSRASR